MNADKVVTVGVAPYVEAAIGKYFAAADGTRYDSKAEVPEGAKVEAACEVFFQIGLPEFTAEAAEAAKAHSAQRKLQEYVSALSRKDNPDVQKAAEDFFARYYFPIILGESRARAAGGAKLDTVETQAIKILAKVLIRKDEGDLKDKAVVKEAMARAKQMRLDDHKWWKVALKKAEAAQSDKGFEE